VAGGSTVRLDGGRLFLHVLTGGWNLLSRSFRLAAGSFIYCDAAAFRAIGGFNEALFASEELDLSRRLKQFGRATGRRFVILKGHPLVTSGRKAQLYSRWEHVRFLARTVLGGGRTLKSREECLIWYDGRR